MKVLELHIQNFRGFREQTFRFSDQFTVLIGDNGTGKTAILEALAVGVGSFLLGIDRMSSRTIQPDEIRRVKYHVEEGDAGWVEPQFPVSVSCAGVVSEREAEWSRSIEGEGGHTTTKDARQIVEIARDLQQMVRDGRQVLLPLIAYYGTGRLWLQKRKRSIQPMKPGSRSRGYAECLDPASNEGMFLRWCKQMEMGALQRKKPIPALDAVRAAIATCMDNWDSVYYDVLRDELVASLADGRILPFRMLSDGVRNMLGMAADIAHRAALLNPHLGKKAARETPGVVLIDEIDLHLHPKWQRRAVDDLRRAFPKIQFVATTHSPFIIQCLRAGELINMNDCSPSAYEGRSIEDIAEDVMGIEVPQRSERYREMMTAAEEYYRVLRQAESASPEEAERLKTRLDELAMPFSDDVAYHAFLKMEREAAGLGDDLGRPAPRQGGAL